MIHLMVVDDEERARSGIRTLIDWESHGIVLQAEARDGAEALELLAAVPVDILMTDIRMPVMDGLELMEQIARLYPQIRCIIMSGYDDFAYAQKALACGASDYLLKPSRTQEILDAVRKQAAVVLEEKAKKENMERLKAGFRDSYPLLKEKTLSRLVLTEQPPYQRLLDTLALNGVVFPHLLFGVMVLQIDNFYTLQSNYTSEDIELFKYALKNIAEESLPGSCHCAAFEYQDDIIVIVNAENWSDFERLLPYVEQMQSNITRHLRFSVSVGIGSPEREAAHLRESYKQAVSALERRYFTGSEKIVTHTYAVEEQSDSEITSYPLAEEKSLLHAVASGGSEEIEAKLLDFHQALRPESTSKEHVLKSMLALVFALYRFCIEKNINTDDIFGEDLTRLSHILSHSSMDTIRASLSEILQKISAQLNVKKNSNKLFQSVLDYIEANYHMDISRETVAREVFITPGYLSLLFKQELKTNFLEVLHKIRTERASELLRDRSLKIGDIAYKVGYNDEKYFYQVYKKYTGMTPSQYRNSLEE